MNQKLRKDIDYIVENSIKAVLPDEAVKKALKNYTSPKGKTVLVAVGKAAWQMAKVANSELEQVDAGIVITKYDHVKGKIGGMECFEAGHPVPDENGFKATQKAIELVDNLSEDDSVIFLISGGGSALFELPLIDAEELQDITKQLLASGASIVEINTIRKRLSQVKGGRFALKCAPAKVFSIVLSDIVADPLDMIASGPVYPDSSTCDQANAIADKYKLKLSEKTKELLNVETPKQLDNVETYITGSVRELCQAAANSCEKLGYKTTILTDELTCEAKEAGSFLASVARTHSKDNEKLAFIAGGETVVRLTGNGTGGRNQELALSSAKGIAGLQNIAIASVGSDGTDGPTDAAGGYVDSDTMEELTAKGISFFDILQNNDSYNALKEINGLIITGATGTNVNDVAVLLIDN